MTVRPLRAAILSLALSSGLALGQEAPAPRGAWTRFRGSPALAGVADTELARPLKLGWTFQAKNAIASSAAIVDGSVCVGSRDGVLHAVDVDTGKERWQYATGSSIEESSPAVRDDVVIGSEDGSLYCFR